LPYFTPAGSDTCRDKKRAAAIRGDPRENRRARARKNVLSEWQEPADAASDDLQGSDDFHRLASRMDPQIVTNASGGWCALQVSNLKRLIRK